MLLGTQHIHCSSFVSFCRRLHSHICCQCLLFQSLGGKKTFKIICEYLEIVEKKTGRCFLLKVKILVWSSLTDKINLPLNILYGQWWDLNRHWCISLDLSWMTDACMLKIAHEYPNNYMVHIMYWSNEYYNICYFWISVPVLGLWDGPPQISLKINISERQTLVMVRGTNYWEYGSQTQLKD